MLTRPRAVAAVLLVAVAVALTGCGDDKPLAQNPSNVSTGPVRLPPAEFEGLQPVIDPMIEPLGLRLARGALVERQTGEPGPLAGHLALYVEPTTTWDDSRFVPTFVPLAQTLTPAVFAMWPSLLSYDVCIEPSPGVDDRPEPRAITVFDVSREYALRTDWRTIDLAALLRAPRNEVTVSFAPHLQQDPLYLAARGTPTTRP